MTSAAFSINSTNVPQASGLAVTTTYGATVTLTLDSVTGANSIEWTIAGVSGPTVSVPTITRAGTPLGATATFTVGSDPGDGSGVAYGVRCKVTDGARGVFYGYGVVGVANAAGHVPICQGEELWRHRTMGWVPLVNLAMLGNPNCIATPAGTPATGEPLAWSGTSWEPVSDVTCGANLQGMPLQNFRNHSGNRTAAGTGAGLALLPLSGATNSLTLTTTLLGGLLTSGNRVRVRVGFEVMVDPNTAGAPLWCDTFEVFVSVAGDVEPALREVLLSDLAGTVEGPTAAFESITITGADSGREYTLSISAENDTVSFQMSQDGSTNYRGRVRTWYDVAEVW